MSCAEFRCSSGSKSVQWAGPGEMQRSDSVWGCGGWKSGSARANMLLQSYITNAWAAQSEYAQDLGFEFPSWVCVHVCMVCILFSGSWTSRQAEKCPTWKKMSTILLFKIKPVSFYIRKGVCLGTCVKCMPEMGLLWRWESCAEGERWWGELALKHTEKAPFPHLLSHIWTYITLRYTLAITHTAHCCSRLLEEEVKANLVTTCDSDLLIIHLRNCCWLLPAIQPPPRASHSLLPLLS